MKREPCIEGVYCTKTVNAGYVLSIKHIHSSFVVRRSPCPLSIEYFNFRIKQCRHPSAIFSEWPGAAHSNVFVISMHDFWSLILLHTNLLVG